ncbi:2-nitropropane dioxygenase family / NPD family [Galdieria sulphuraria]|uniref:2-nitropropane dioxygenase family / NPD family n=1 Tax=Galdieria sulphuraria TaxID=130081 RepID=M2XZE7_GALSU|nr:2-nitropropane dioxygenase family / NPD family [Galdieria sulphuraria]EME28949.1 2-nitropropane dioxygenase family / NPD family [Galdieria sulphuraria]|eukprot:XP_005705469.1 2-nitropropane dioxygenase family / NPD family [Galdieria sulphuraria]
MVTKDPLTFADWVETAFLPMHTDICRILKISLPLLLSPLAGGPGTPQLAANVSNSGGLGSLACAYHNGDQIRSAIRQTKQLTGKPFAVNIFVHNDHLERQFSVEEWKVAIDRIRKRYTPVAVELEVETGEKIRVENDSVESFLKNFRLPSMEEQLHVILEEKPPVFTFTFGLLSSGWVQRFHSKNILVGGTCTTVEEAKQLESLGVDFISVQGAEAGGHRGSFHFDANHSSTRYCSSIQLETLLLDCLSVIKLPLIAAGGISNGRQIRSLLRKGASGVQLGTLFMTCKEAGTSAIHRQILQTAKPSDTTITSCFTGRSARGYRNRVVDYMESFGSEFLPFPYQSGITRGIGNHAAKYLPAIRAANFMQLWMGQSVPVKHNSGANELIEVLRREWLDSD